MEITPTFVGCPALDMMKSEIKKVLMAYGVARVEIEISYRKPWTSDLISEKGRLALKEFGLAPPPMKALIRDLDILEQAACPRCNGLRTELRSPFGSTLCRSIFYCHDCKESFEQFKPL
jgi:ring-1,2-phenylacetyl-CoA epoxidase subunit PaaD